MTVTPSLGLPRVASALAFLFALLVLLAPALWNGYPLIYFDSEDYVNMSFTFDLIIWRTMPYALFVTIGRPFGSLFAVVVVQALIAAWVLHELAAAFLPQWKTVGLVILSTLLAVFTGLPWVTSQLLPDALTGLPVLGLAVLAFGEQLPRWRRVALVLPIAVAIATHMSHLAVAVGLLLALGLLRAFAWRGLAWPRPAVGLSVLAVSIGMIAVPAVHKWATGEAFFSRSGRVLQLALFVQNGIAKRYLDLVCPEGAPLKLCAYRDRLPDTADAFLWAPWASPFYRLGGWKGMTYEAESIVVGAVQRFPGEVMREALENAAAQLGTLKLGDGLIPKNRPNRPGEYYDTAKARYPQEFNRYMNARQQQGNGIDFRPINAAQVPVAFVAQAALLALLVGAWRRHDRAGVGLALLVVLALLGNAAICGAVSNPHDRYQNRIAWIATAGCLVLMLRQHRQISEALAVQPQNVLAKLYPERGLSFATSSSRQRHDQDARANSSLA